MTFHDVELPSDYQYTSQFGAGFATVIQETSSGHEVRVGRQSQARHRFRLQELLKSQSEASDLKEFGLRMRGALDSFKVKDASDFTTADDGKSAPTNLDCVLGTGDGTTKTFQLCKRYAKSLSGEYARTITVPVVDTDVVAVAGTPKTRGADYTVTSPGGIVTFTTAPTAGQVVTAGCEFRVPVRFAASVDEWNAMRADAFDVWSLAQLELIEVLDEVLYPERSDPGGVTNWGAIGADFTMSLAQGSLQRVQPSTAISGYLPVPPLLWPGGHDVFVLHVDGGAGSVQPRDDTGVALGSTMSSGSVAVFDCFISGATATWVRR